MEYARAMYSIVKNVREYISNLVKKLAYSSWMLGTESKTIASMLRMIVATSINSNILSIIPPLSSGLKMRYSRLRSVI
jgi:hypothetical protein